MYVISHVYAEIEWRKKRTYTHQRIKGKKNKKEKKISGDEHAKQKLRSNNDDERGGWELMWYGF